MNRLFSFAILPGDFVPVTKHLMQSYFHRPTQSRVDQASTGQAEVHLICKPRSFSDAFKVMAMGPLRKRALYLLIHKQAVSFVRGVYRNPRQETDAQLDARTGFQTAAFAHHFHGRKRRRKQQQSIRALMKREI